MALGSVLALLAAGLGEASRPRAIAFLALRLLIFATTIFWMSRQFGAPAAVCVLVTAVLTRGVLSRREADVGGGSTPSSSS